MRKRGFVIGGLIIVVAVAGFGVWHHFMGGSSTASDGNVVYVTKVSDLSESNLGTQNRFAGVVEPQETVKVNIESGRVVKEVQVSVGDEVKQGQLLFEYDLSSIQDSLKEAQLDLDRLKNEATSLTQQIATLEKEKKSASKDSQLSYTIEIESNKMSLKKNEYSQESKQAEIDKLQAATTNTEVRSEIDGVIQKIDTSKLSSDDGDTLDEGTSLDYSSDSSSDSSAFITILSTGAYRVKGKVNELNRSSIVQGESVIVRSRADETQTWKGTLSKIDEQNSDSDSSESSVYGDSSSSDSSSSSYPFYVDLESSDGLMLGQHVYIELDEGQDEVKSGVWLSDFYIVDADSANPYVWVAGENGKLEKRDVILGQYDENLMEYEIADGLTEDDSIAFPSEALEEGLATADVSTMPEGADVYYTGDSEDSDTSGDGEDVIVDDSEEDIELGDEIDESAYEEDTSYDEDGVTYESDDMAVDLEMDMDEDSTQTYGSEDVEAAG